MEEARFEDEPTTVPAVSTAASPIAAEETAEEAFAPSPRKSGRRAQKKVVTVPIDGGEGLIRKSKREVYPPPDNWTWRKYGQKPIKGSPYPRGYYRCSSSKGCPARKQVERSHIDPTTLLVTYSADHNHPRPPPAANHHRDGSKPTSSSTDDEDEEEDAAGHGQSSCSNTPEEEEELCIEPAFVELAGELGWLCSVGPTIDSNAAGTSLVGPMPWERADVEVFFMPIGGEEEQHLFGDLGDLPDSSVVFRWCRQLAETPCAGS